MALMFIMALMATNWELFKKSKSKSEKINLELLDLLASPQVKRRRLFKLSETKVAEGEEEERWHR